MPFISDKEITKDAQVQRSKEDLMKNIQALKNRQDAKEQFEKEKPFKMNDWFKVVKGAKTVNAPVSKASEGESLGISSEDSNEIKDTIIKVLALPQKDTARNDMLQRELKKSQTINQYIDNNVMYRVLSMCNDHLKFCAVYAIKYAHCNSVKITE